MKKINTTIILVSVFLGIMILLLIGPSVIIGMVVSEPPNNNLNKCFTGFGSHYLTNSPVFMVEEVNENLTYKDTPQFSDTYSSLKIYKLNNEPIYFFRDNLYCCGSMKPLIKGSKDKKYGVLTIIPDSESDIKVGDLIAFETPSGDVGHRVINITKVNGKTIYTTKGDNIAQVDPLINSFPLTTFEDIKYKYIGILY